MKKYLFKLSVFLSKEGFVNEANKVSEFSKEIQRDWDVEEEERKLSSDPKDIDKTIRETSPRPGWFLPAEESANKTSKEKFSWIKEDAEKHLVPYHSIDETELTSKFISAFNTFSDGSRPKYIGHGAWGIVWNIGNNKYLKIYSKSVDQPKTDLTRGLIFEKIPFAEYELMVHATGSFDFSGDGLQKGWKIMERLLNFDDLEKKDPVFASKLKSLIQTIRFFIGEVVFYGDDEGAELFTRLRKKFRNKDVVLNVLRDPIIIREIEELSDYLESKVRKKINSKFKNLMADKLDLNEEWLSGLIKHMIVVILTGRDDLHLGNIGLRPATGTFVFFDA